MVKPVCGNGICEGGEGEICSTTSINKILCEEGSECKVPPIVCKIICPEDCKGIEEKIVLANLGEKFKLQVSQIAKIQDYPMKIVLKDIIAYKCKETHINEVQQEVIKEKITAANEVIAQTVPASTTSTSATVSEPNPSVSSSTSGGASSSTNPITGNPIKNNAVVAKPQPVSETKPEILKCVGAGPKALLKIHIPNDKFVSEKILNLDLNEKKRIGEVTIAFIDYDYASRTGVFVVLKDDFSCPENCKCDKEGKTIECREEKCPKGQSLCPDGTCSEKCEIIVKPEECNYGCSVDGRCFPIGIRTNGTYCGIDLVMSSQKSSDEVCDNNFECNSNICVNGKCISASFLNQIMSWFRKLFGAE
jgi:hypothetical protein